MARRKTESQRGRIEAVLQTIEKRFECFATNHGPIANAHDGFGVIAIELLDLENKVQFSTGSNDDYRWIRIDAINLAAAAIHFVAMLTDDKYARVVRDVEAELDRATKQYAAFSSMYEAYAVVREEVEELWDEIKKKDRDLVKMRKEAIQVAAMAVRTALDICGGKK